MAPGQSGSQLDNVFSNLDEGDILSEIYIADVSDHYGQIVKINIDSKNQYKQTYIKKDFLRIRIY